jgi:hypothetical protein
MLDRSDFEMPFDGNPRENVKVRSQKGIIRRRSRYTLFLEAHPPKKANVTIPKSVYDYDALDNNISWEEIHRFYCLSALRFCACS